MHSRADLTRKPHFRIRSGFQATVLIHCQWQASLRKGICSNFTNFTHCWSRRCFATFACGCHGGWRCPDCRLPVSRPPGHWAAGFFKLNLKQRPGPLGAARPRGSAGQRPPATESPETHWQWAATWYSYCGVLAATVSWLSIELVTGKFETATQADSFCTSDSSGRRSMSNHLVSKFQVVWATGMMICGVKRSWTRNLEWCSATCRNNFLSHITR